ncbi:MAG TPA: hypothetical protein PLF11_05975 [Bacillota bacterium]|nr:hypothetical protein [Bacillota bacterium]
MEELVEQCLALALGTGLEEGLATAASGGQSASKAQAVQRGTMTACGFEHEAAHQVVHEEVEADFAFEVPGGFAAQVIHLEGDFEVAHGQFPPTVAKLSGPLRVVLCRQRTALST